MRNVGCKVCGQEHHKEFLAQCLANDLIDTANRLIRGLLSVPEAARILRFTAADVDTTLQSVGQ